MKKIKQSNQNKKNVRYKKSDFVYYLKNFENPLFDQSSLNELRKNAIELKINVNKVLVYRKNLKTGKSTLLSLYKYAFKNKLYGPSKSVDGTGFYYEWSWKKKTPFEQPPIKPLPESFSSKPKEIVIENAVQKKVTFWQLIKRYIGNIFN